MADNDKDSEEDDDKDKENKDKEEEHEDIDYDQVGGIGIDDPKNSVFALKSSKGKQKEKK